MASYSTIPAAEEPLVAKPQGKSLKALVAGAAVASFALGALAATAVSSSVAAPEASFYKPMYVLSRRTARPPDSRATRARSTASARRSSKSRTPRLRGDAPLPPRSLMATRLP